MLRVAAVTGIAFVALLAGSTRETASAEPTANCAEDGGQTAPARVGLGVRPTGMRFDGVMARITPRRPASGLTGCEQLAGMVAIGNSFDRILVAKVYAHSRLPGRFVIRYEWGTGGYWYTQGAVLPGMPWRAGRPHLFRLERVRPTADWLVEIDGRNVDRIRLPGSQRGLEKPRAELVTRNSDGTLNRGSFRFDDVRVRPRGGDGWAEFPRGRSWLYTYDRHYTYTSLPGRTSFIAKSS